MTREVHLPNINMTSLTTRLTPFYDLRDILIRNGVLEFQSSVMYNNHLCHCIYIKQSKKSNNRERYILIFISDHRGSFTRLPFGILSVRIFSLCRFRPERQVISYCLLSLDPGEVRAGYQLGKGIAHIKECLFKR